MPVKVTLCDKALKLYIENYASTTFKNNILNQPYLKIRILTYCFRNLTSEDVTLEQLTVTVAMATGECEAVTDTRTLSASATEENGRNPIGRNL